MKKIFVLLGVLLSIACFSANASKSSVYLEFYKSGHASQSTAVRRFPTPIYINVYYDDVSRLIEITGDKDRPVQIYLYDVDGNVLECTSSLNSSIAIPYDYSGPISIYIEGEGWTAQGQIDV